MWQHDDRLDITEDMVIYEKGHGEVIKGETVEFVHPLLGVGVDAIGGHYLFIKEEELDHRTGKILYLVGYAVTDRSCCGLAGCGYAVVAGHVRSLRNGLSHDKRPVSTVEPIEEKLYDEVAKAIRMKEALSQVHFLCESGGTKVLF